MISAIVLFSLMKIYAFESNSLNIDISILHDATLYFLTKKDITNARNIQTRSDKLFGIETNT